MGHYAEPDTSLAGNVSSGIDSIAYRKCHCDSSREPSGGSAYPAGHAAVARFHVDARTLAAKRVHGSHAVDERFAGGGLEPARAARLDSGSGDGGNLLVNAAWRAGTGVGAGAQAYHRSSCPLAGTGCLAADVSGAPTKTGVRGIMVDSAGCRAGAGGGCTHGKPRLALRYRSGFQC